MGQSYSLANVENGRRARSSLRLMHHHRKSKRSTVTAVSEFVQQQQQAATTEVSSPSISSSSWSVSAAQAQQLDQSLDLAALQIVSHSSMQLLSASAMQLRAKESHCSICFIDICDFTSITQDLTPQQLLLWLSSVHSCINSVAQEFNVIRIKTMGDGALFIIESEQNQNEHLRRMLLFALALKRRVASVREPGTSRSVRLRAGIAHGDVVLAEAICDATSNTRVVLDVLGNAVSLASRLEELSHGDVEGVHISEQLYDTLVRDSQEFQGIAQSVHIKGFGTCRIWHVTKR